VWAALLLQLWLTVDVVITQGRGFAMGLVVYFGFFTVLTNLLAAVCMSAFVIGSRLPGYRTATHPVAITTVAAAITMVGLVYFLVLRHTWKPEGAQFVADVALHYVNPILVVLYWFVVVPAGAITWRTLPWLFAYPLTYLVYIFGRGEVFEIYPYFFIDVGQIGYSMALRNSLGVLVAYGLVLAVLVGLKNLSVPPGRRQLHR
jgi:hypothetical protein